MKNTQRLIASVILALSTTAVLMAQAPPASARVATTRTAPDEFGMQDYVVTTIPCHSFTTADENWDQCVFGFDQGGPYPGGHVFTGVNVPSGAVIDFVGLQSCTPSSGPGGPHA